MPRPKVSNHLYRRNKAIYERFVVLSKHPVKVKIGNKEVVGRLAITDILNTMSEEFFLEVQTIQKIVRNYQAE
jgi:hypothetical protein